MMPSTKFWQIANLLGLIAVITVNALANALPINGKNTGELSDLYPNLFVPAGLTFSIWGVIYLLLISFVLYEIRQAFAKAPSRLPHLEKIGGFFLLSCVANVSWILAWHYLQIYLSLGIMLVILGSLIAIYERLEIGKTKATRAEMFRVRLPFSVYLGWISIATIANTTAVLVYSGWDGWGMGPVGWAVLLIVIGLLLTLRMLVARRDIFYALVVGWAYLGIIIKRSQVDLADTQSIVITAAIALGLIAMGVVVKFRPYRRLFTS